MRKAIVRNVKTNDLYSWDGEKFTNLRTNISGFVSDEAAQKTFVINLDATELCNEYPVIEEMIKSLNLKIDVCSLPK